MGRNYQEIDPGIWISQSPQKRAEFAPQKKETNVSRKRRSKDKSKTEKFLENTLSVIEKNGNKNIKFSNLLKEFAYKRRTDRSIQNIIQFLSDNDLYAMPELSTALDRNANIQLYKFPVKSLGDLFEYEAELEKFVLDTKAYKQLGFTGVDEQYSPKGTKDRLDFRAEDKEHNYSVIELKNKGGGKSAVEQVIRYAGQLQSEGHSKKIRKILITGIQNLETAETIYGLTDAGKKEFEWYLYKYDKKQHMISFESVDYEELAKYFKS
jgi:RecB family endonuclease NucS